MTISYYLRVILRNGKYINNMFGVENEHLENDTDLMDEKSSGCRKPAAGCVIFVEQVICATLI